MSEPKDAELLRRYADEKSEVAFGELVRRQVNLVYSIALRQCGGDAHLAEDVAQRVFTDLARKARSLSGYAVLGGWLYRSAQFAASDVVRAERRRRAREQEAQAMQQVSDPAAGDADWQKLAPVLDQAIGELAARDRDAVVLRFFEGRPFAEIGTTLRLTEDAARMRVERALDKLRAALVRRGITSTTAALGVVLANQAAAVAPAGVAASVTGAALIGAAASGSAGAWLAFFSMSKITVAIVSVIVVAGVVTTVSELRASREVQAEVNRLELENRDLGKVRAESRRLAATVAKPEESNPEVAELARLRGQIAQLRAQATPVTGGVRPNYSVAGELKPAAVWKNAGWATPMEAFETLLWARATGDDAAVLRSVDIRVETKAKLDAFFAMLPAEVRAKYGVPERLVLHALLVEADPVIEFRVMRLEKTSIQSFVQPKVTRASGREEFMNLPFVRVGDEWRLEMTGPAERVARGADPTGAWPWMQFQSRKP